MDSPANQNSALYFVDRHIVEGRADKTAFIEADGDRRELSYGGLSDASARFAGALLRSGGRRAAFVIGLVRLSPVMPFAGTNLLMAASGVRLVPFALGSGVGLAPRVLALVFASAGLSHLDFGEPGQGAMAIVGIVATVLGLLLLGVLAKRALREQLGSLDQKS